MELIFNISEFNKLIQSRSLNMTETANLMNISRSHLWRILHQQCNPGEQFIAGFKRAFPNEELDKFFLLKVLQRSDNDTA